MKSAVYLARAAVIAAVYAVCTVVTAPISFGEVQFRIAECLCILAFFYDEAVIGLTVGCFIANLFSPSGVLDVFLGTFATFLACFLSNVCYKAIKGKIVGFIVGVSFPIIVNAIIVPIAIIAAMPESNFGVYAIFALQIGAGQAGVLMILGLALYLILLKLIDKGALKQTKKG